jgi:hypothetical protein
MEYFVSGKSLDAGFSYLFVFAAKANNDIGMAFVKTPADNPKQHTEIKLDNKMRLFVIPFKMTESQHSPQFSIQTNNYCSVMKPILIKAPARNSQGSIEPILQVNVAGHIISYNPWLNQDTRIKKEKGCQFLTSDYGIYRNPLILFMKLLRLKIPLDLYKYSWKSKYDGFSEIFAVRY